MYLTTRPSTCHSSHLKAQRAMEAKRREQAVRQHRARRAKLAQKGRAKHLQVRLVEADDDALLVSLRVLNQYPEHAQLRIDANGPNSLRVAMVGLRPAFKRVQDFWGHQRLVQHGVEKFTIFSETISFKTDVPLLVNNVQARAVNHDTVIVRIPYAPQQVEENDVDDADDDVVDDAIENDNGEYEVTVATGMAEGDPQREAVDHEMGDGACEEATAAPAPEASEGSFEIPIDVDTTSEPQEIEQEKSCDEECVEVTAAPAEEISSPKLSPRASADSFEIPIDGSIEDCDLDE